MPTATAVGRRELVEPERCGRAVGDPEQDREEREEERDLPRLAEVPVDRVLAERADDRRGHGCDRDRPGEPLVRVADRARADRRAATRAVADDVVPEVDDDRDERAEVERRRRTSC